MLIQKQKDAAAALADDVAAALARHCAPAELAAAANNAFPPVSFPLLSSFLLKVTHRLMSS